MIDRRSILTGAVSAGLALVALRGARAEAPAAVEPAESFAGWLARLRADASKDGVLSPVLDRAFDGLRPLPLVLDFERRQAEPVSSFEHTVSPERIAAGRGQLAEHRALLDRIAEQYRVPPQIIVAVWGIQSDYGTRVGDLPAIPALATLGWAGSRPEVFRRELIHALHVIQNTGIAPRDLKGSWAGALGQTQFQPSSYLKYAVADDGSSCPDIWSSKPDIFASIGNCLAHQGWKAGDGWGQVDRQAASLLADRLVA